MKFLVARDGIEPPTPAFSGLDSPVSKLLIPIDLSQTKHEKWADLLAHC